MRARMRKLKMTRWGKLTRGEKVAKVILTIVKFVVLGSLIAIGITAIVSVAVAIFVASAVIDAVCGGLDNASKAYRPGDRYVNVRFW